MLTITERPNALCWTGNRIAYTIGHSAESLTDYLQLKAAIWNGVAYVQTAEVRYPFSSATGSITVPIEKLLDPNLAFELPPLDAGAAIRERVIGKACEFYILYKRVSDSIWKNDFANAIRIVKGGKGDMRFAPEAAVNKSPYTVQKFMPAGSRFLTYTPNGRLLTPAEMGWLLFLSDYNYYNGTSSRKEFWALYTVTHTDGSTATYTRDFENVTGTSNVYNRAWWLPVGVLQAGLQPTGKQVLSFKVEVWRQYYNGSAWLNEVVAAKTFQVDNRPLPGKRLTLYYQNGMGGMDHILLRGRTSAEAGAERQEAGIALPDASQGSDIYFDTNLRPKWSGVTGYISKAHAVSLLEALSSRKAFLLTTWNNVRQWLPVRVTTSSLPYQDSAEPLCSVKLEFESAGSYNFFPEQITTLL